MIDVKLEPKFHFIVNISQNGAMRISYVPSQKNVAQEIVEWLKSNQIEAYTTSDSFIVANTEHFNASNITVPLEALFKSYGLKVNYTWPS